MGRGIRWLAACVSVGCTSVPSMSASQHDEAAARETQSAEADRAEYHPGVRTEVLHCGPFRGGDNDLQPEVPPPCWSELINPTSRFLAESQQHERVAKAHEAASRDEHEAEDKACAGISERDRHTSLFLHNKDIVSIAIDSDSPNRLIGATVVFAQVPGLTVPWLQRVLDCHLAIHGVVDRGAADESPLAGPGVKAMAVQGRNSAEVILRGESQSATNVIVERIKSLQSAHRVELGATQ
jgi:hypothetical protein